MALVCVVLACGLSYARRMATRTGFDVLGGSEPTGDPEQPEAGGRIHRRRFWVAIPVFAALIAILVDLSGLGRRAGTSRLGSASPTQRLPLAGLPALGPSMAVEVANPALNDIGDPYVLPVPAGVDDMSTPGYVLYWTTDWSANIPTAISSDLVHWRRLADSLPTLPSWALLVHPPRSFGAAAGVSTMTWGPTVHKVAGGWALYYSTEDAGTRRECLGVAFSVSPTGPFADDSHAPLVCQASLGGDIDPSVVAPAPGRLALLWKNDGNANGSTVSIWEQALTANGTATVGSPERLLDADMAWEHGIIEGPAMLADSRGGWWLFYSGGTWQSDTYDTGVAWCATVAGPCHEPARGPLLASTPSSVSPGGLDTFIDHHGQLWAAYSAFPTAPANARAAFASPRVLELAPITSH